MSFFLKNAQAVKSLIVFGRMYKGVQFRYSTGFSVPVKQWDERNQKCKTRGIDKTDSDRNKHINGQLSKIEEEVQKAIVRANTLEQRITKEYLRQSLNNALKDGYTAPNGIGGKLTLLELLERFVQDSETGARTSRDGNRIQAKRLQVYETFKSVIGKHFPNILANDIDYSFQQRLIAYYNGKDYARNTIGKYMAVLTAALRHGKYLGLCEAELLNHPNRSKLHERSLKVFLNKQEIQVLLSRELTGTAERVRDIFVMMCYLGVRISDYEQLDTDRLVEDGKKVKIITSKTKEPVTIPVHPIVRRILIKYSGFPVPISPQKMNKYVKDICEDAEINQPFQTKRTIGGKTQIIEKPKYEFVGLHTARRSFATNAYLAGMDPITIMRITGHKKESTFMRYICVTDDQQAERMMRHAFFKG